MALFGPQARLERCLWWAELTSWPRGASEERISGCYDRVFGRTTHNGGPSTAGRLKSVQFKEAEPKNDMLTLVMVIAAAYLVYKYILKK